MNNNKIIDPPCLKSKKKEQEEANGEIKKSEELLSNKQFESYLSGKGEWLPTHDIKYDEEDETPIEDRIPKKVKNDFYLGDLLELVIDLQHPKKPEIKKTDIPNWLPLKLSLLGYAFAGKKTLAELVQ
jgi:hypothetical protein